MQLNRCIVFSFLCKILLIIKTLALLRDELLIKTKHQRLAICSCVYEFCSLNYCTISFHRPIALLKNTVEIDTTQKKKTLQFQENYEEATGN